MWHRNITEVAAMTVIATVFGATFVACSSTYEVAQGAVVTETSAGLEAVAVDTGNEPVAQARRGGQGGDAQGSGGQGSGLIVDTTEALTESELEGLMWMREEEKLARDVYLTLFERWQTPIFENIAGSEQQHTDAVLRIIDAYGLDDPSTDDTVGVFTNPVLQGLYDDLVEQGSQSLIDALAVGALIEDLDISDLQRWLTETDNAAIVSVYTNLLKGSENHLRAFVRQLEANGSEFEPVYLEQDVVDEILAGQSGQRPGGGNGGRRPGSQRNNT
jgi:hypothetical protein